MTPAFMENRRGDMFRTTPLWGLVLFLHDGRTDDLLVAIQAHAGGDDDDRGGSGPQGDDHGNTYPPS